MTAVPDRIAFAVEAMAPRPGMRVLEIGCGGGVAVSLVHERIGPDGTILGVDGSATQIDRARRRNEAAAGVELRVARFPDVDGGPFDLIFAIDVPAFRSGDPAVPAAAAALLRPGGELWVFDEPPPGTATGPISMRISALLSEAGFAIVDMVERGRTVGVLAAPPESVEKG
ncbi:class I SAM-dependent methyltransferase [Rhodococcus sp. NPDC003382]|uniref:class I SAM-dependent methyltransferase n=1 Tax=unclassified Rhodococcus (in: high G+C Gram-positive bacteria) TaxID=192944 RepID=UPI0018CF0F5A|nr:MULTISPECIES: methyltransferase domain-containing protein [unclassified Rhodococcus (in: high G+C Gram-positive bacteria)]MBH0118010.1 methyltransferase domain-containing protein [Rhodococcus sp. CX]MCK8675145.1 class I SAM-dependent methyltransferase [Rhodococcus sp. HM1]